MWPWNRKGHRHTWRRSEPYLMVFDPPNPYFGLAMFAMICDCGDVKPRPSIVWKPKDKEWPRLG